MKIDWSDFETKELKQLKKIDLNKIITKLHEKRKPRTCANCGSKHKRMVLNKVNPHGMISECTHFFCSSNCLKEYFNQNKKPFLKPEPRNLITTTALNLSAFCDKPETLTVSDLSQALKKELEKRKHPLYNTCDYCHKHKKNGWYIELAHEFKHTYDVLKDLQYCSKECLNKSLKEIELK